MTDEELKELVAENSRAARELRASVVELRASHAEARQDSDRRWQESDRRWQAIQEEMRASRRDFQEEIAASRREMDRALSSMSRTVESVSRDIGRFHNKFGDYSETLCQPSLKRTLRERFRMSEIAPRVLAFNNGDTLELDMLAHANDQINEVYGAEIKTRLRQEGIDQILDHLRAFPTFFPEHRAKKLYGILAAIEAPADLQRQVIREGLYLMLIRFEAHGRGRKKMRIKRFLD
ncbi:MAG: DUF3782 domain-containing protein [bacterium]|nr:DUF3782 domain-containing protein [bacterium]